MLAPPSPWAAAADLFDPPATVSHLSAYRYDPAGFVRDCFKWAPGEGPTAYQIQILDDFAHSRRIAVRGPHGLGKTALDAWVVLWFALTRDDAGDNWKIATTASAWRQLQDFLWPEIHLWAGKLDWSKLGRAAFNAHELLQLNLKLSSGAAFAVASDRPASLEGAHADQLLYLFDEAKTIPGELFDAAEGAFSGAGAGTKIEAFALANSTPGETSGRFYDICRRAPGFDDWHTIHVRLEQAIAAGRISTEWAAQRKTQWGETSAVYQNRVLGEFCADDTDGVIPLAWVEAANQRWADWHALGAVPQLTCVGVDVARGGGDKSVLAIRHGQVISELIALDVRDVTVVADRVAVYTILPGVYSVIDDMGVGGGVTDTLRRLGQDHQPVPFIAAATDNTLTDSSGLLTMRNNRAAAWWNMRDLLDPAHDHQIALPPNDLLTGDLTAPHWKVVTGGRIQIESKDDMRARIGRSTDYADAVIQAFWPAYPQQTVDVYAWTNGPKPIMHDVLTMNF